MQNFKNVARVREFQGAVIIIKEEMYGTINSY